jgi:hypothetical protein
MEHVREVLKKLNVLAQMQAFMAIPVRQMADRRCLMERCAC